MRQIFGRGKILRKNYWYRRNKQKALISVETRAFDGIDNELVLELVVHVELELSAFVDGIAGFYRPSVVNGDGTERQI